MAISEHTTIAARALARILSVRPASEEVGAEKTRDVRSSRAKAGNRKIKASSGI